VCVAGPGTTVCPSGSSSRAAERQRPTPGASTPCRMQQVLEDEGDTEKGHGL
jgi:hypothetical protein